MVLKISKDVSLPVDIVTQTIAILAKRRAGKSYTMRRLVEQLFKANQQVVIVDPKGDQWGIRSSADGKKPGFPIVILGGEHGDVPLEANAGEVVAKLVVEERVSVLLDLSLFRKHEVATFMAMFLENLYRLKAHERYRTPVMLVIDEADAVAPQKPQQNEARMLGAAEDIVRRGGQRGIGCCLVTQRSAVLNKNVLTQAQMLIVLRTIAPQDLAAMNAWIDVHGEPAQRKVLMESLPALPVGDAWFWSPGWPTADGIFKRSHVLPIETFDSGATPKPGQKPVVPKNLADIDLGALTKQMAATIEKARNDDPKQLRKRIAELEGATKKHVVVAGQITIDAAVKAALRKREGEFEKERAGYQRMVAGYMRAFKDIEDALVRAGKAGEIVREAPTHPAAPAEPRQPIRVSRAAAPSEVQGGSGIGSSMQKILDALLLMEQLGNPSVDKRQLALLSDQRPTSGGYFNNLGSLRSNGYIEYPSAGIVQLTNEGRTLARNGGISDNAEMHDLIRSKLSKPQKRMLDVLIEIYPAEISKDELAQRTEQRETSGGYFNNLGSMRTLGVLDYPSPGKVRATDILFPFL